MSYNLQEIILKMEYKTADLSSLLMTKVERLTTNQFHKKITTVIWELSALADRAEVALAHPDQMSPP